MPTVSVRNPDVADALERVAALLEAQGANPYRVRAYRAASETVRRLPRSLATLREEGGSKAILGLKGVGKSIGAAIEEMLQTGGLRRLDRLQGELGPEALFTSLPGIGEDLAHRIHDCLGVETLEDLEIAAHDGRLANVKGFGPQRIRGVRDTLASVLGQDVRRRVRQAAPDSLEHARSAPRVATLLDVDAEYRRKADLGTLRLIAPRRFNPRHEAWLPILHSEGGGWSFTALYSNTARAHAMGTTRDWVVIFFERDGIEGHVTVVTERRGTLEGKRVIRGREAECERHYADERRGPGASA